MIVIIAVVVFYFCTYAKHRLEKVVKQVNVLPKFGDNYLSVGSLGLAVSMFSSSDVFTVTYQFTHRELKCNVFQL